MPYRTLPDGLLPDKWPDIGGVSAGEAYEL